MVCCRFRLPLRSHPLNRDRVTSVDPRNSLQKSPNQSSYVTVTSQFPQSPRRTPSGVQDGADASASLRSWARDEPMREVRVDREGLTAAQLLHDDEVQTVHGAVRLILVSLK